MKKLRTVAIAFAALASVMAFSAASTLPVASAATATAAKTTTLKLSVGSGLSYNTKSLKAAAGTVVIKFTNSTKTGHDVAVEKGSSGKGKVIAKTAIFSGGTKTLTLKNLKAGKYTYFCTVPGHRAAGMSGTLTITKSRAGVIY